MAVHNHEWHVVIFTEGSIATMTRRDFLGQIAASAVIAGTGRATGGSRLPHGPLISLWEHAAGVDIAPVVKELGFNTVWTHDKPYDGKIQLDQTLMWRHMTTPGVKYVVAKVDRGIWGWSFDQAMRHGEWIANLAKAERRIIGLYLNDYYQEVHSVSQGGHTARQFQQIVTRVRSINPELTIFAPVYPTKESDELFEFDFDALICNIHFDMFDRKMLPTVEQSIFAMEKKFAPKPILTGLYFNSGHVEGGGPAPSLSEQEFRFLMRVYVQHISEGRSIGLRIFRAQDFIIHPEYVTWTKEELAKLKVMEHRRVT